MEIIEIISHNLCKSTTNIFYKNTNTNTYANTHTQLTIPDRVSSNMSKIREPNTFILRWKPRVHRNTRKHQRHREHRMYRMHPVHRNGCMFCVKASVFVCFHLLFPACLEPSSKNIVSLPSVSVFAFFYSHSFRLVTLLYRMEYKTGTKFSFEKAPEESL